MPRLLRPSWLLGHVLLVAAVLVMARLGVWQWGRGEATGSLRNYSYGVEWFAFAGLSVLGWVKHCRDEVLAASGEAASGQAGTGRAGSGRAGRVRDGAPATPVAAAVPLPSADEDPEVAAWNARFAELARRDAGAL